jgi:hypothetical protein
MLIGQHTGTINLEYNGLTMPTPYLSGSSAICRKVHVLAIPLL